ncbi:unnamed protein product, partial [Rotaria sp. Silwood2]
LSGLSPFAGQDDNETIENIYFIQKLLLKNRNSRMSVHDALDHLWLCEDHPELDSPNKSSRFDHIR